ncbi:hypothetical protein PR048_032830 [Dryococelus australis]|uniref:HTH psq-type domain-containing protein n=1 Tax=Dryococelus australis TaxID=614101 RepID=A0ABQ9G6I0_9NEOP|nr:hypothetical protein PR048_032830 [Dryococelus australis]
MFAYSNRAGMMPQVGNWGEGDLNKSANAIKENFMGLNEAANAFNIPKTTLKRRLKKNDFLKRPLLNIQKLQTHVFRPSRSCVRSMAFRLAEKLKIKHNFDLESQNACYDWLQSFLIRNPELSVGKKPAGKVLLVIDGHSSLCSSVDMLEFADEHDTILLGLPCHTTRFLRPLNRRFFKSFKSNYNIECNAFTRNNPSRQITRLQFSKLFGFAWSKSATVENYCFRVQGTWNYSVKNMSAIPHYAYLTLSEDSTTKPPPPPPPVQRDANIGFTSNQEVAIGTDRPLPRLESALPRRHSNSLSVINAWRFLGLRKGAPVSSESKMLTLPYGTVMVDRLDYPPHTKAKLVQSLSGSLPDFLNLDSCQTILLVGGYSGDLPFSPALAFRRCSTIASFHPLWLSEPHTDIKHTTVTSRRRQQSATLSPERMAGYAEFMRRGETNSKLRRLPSPHPSHPAKCLAVLTQRNIFFDPLAIEWCIDWAAMPNTIPEYVTIEFSGLPPTMVANLKTYSVVSNGRPETSNPAINDTHGFPLPFAEVSIPLFPVLVRDSATSDAWPDEIGTQTQPKQLRTGKTFFPSSAASQNPVFQTSSKTPRLFPQVGRLRWLSGSLGLSQAPRGREGIPRNIQRVPEFLSVLKGSMSPRALFRNFTFLKDVFCKHLYDDNCNASNYYLTDIAYVSNAAVSVLKSTLCLQNYCFLQLQRDLFQCPVLVWTNRTMVSSNTDTKRTGVLAGVETVITLWSKQRDVGAVFFWTSLAKEKIMYEEEHKWRMLRAVNRPGVRSHT